jgi:hypothetical protein
MLENILTEKVNFSVAEKLSSINYIQFKDLFNLSTTKRHSDYDLMAEYTKLKNYCIAVVKSKNNHKVKYNFVKGKKCGRLQSQGPSIQRLYNGFRGVLVDGIMWDLDMVNCHPVIIANLCKENNIKYNLLHDYIKNRETFLSELMTDYDISRSAAKTVLLKSLNKIDLTTKINNKKVKIKTLFRKFDLELTEISKQLFEIYKNDIKYKKYLTNDWNKEGKYMNLILCDMENNYLQEARKVLKDNGIKNENAVLMFDGFMIYTDFKDEDYLNNIIDILNNNFKKYEIKWDYKSHNTELLGPLNDLVIEEVDTIECENIIEIVNHILDGILKDRLYKDCNSLYFLTEEKIITNEKAIKAELYKLISKQNYFMLEGDKVINCSKIHKNINNICDGLINCCETNTNFVNDVWTYTQFKLFFNNGYFDFKKNVFVEGKNNKTFIKINKNYSGISNKEIRTKIYSKIFYPVFSIENKDADQQQYELMEYYLYMTSQFMAGNIEMKKWLNFQGLRNSGKGVLGDLLKKSFEKYVLTTNSGNFKFKSNVTDEQKALSWLIDYQFTRVALTSEIDIADDMKLNGNMIKKFTSGGDDLMARKNFKDEYEFKMQSGLIIMSNDMPPIQPTDAMETCDIFTMKSKFIDKNFLEKNKLNGYKYYPKDPYIKTDFINNDDVLNEFIIIILEYYNKHCEYPAKLLEDLVLENESEDDMSKLFSLYEFTNDPNDKIENDNLRVDLKYHKINMSIIKMRKLLRTKGAEPYRNKNHRGLAGMRHVTEHETSEDDYAHL